MLCPSVLLGFIENKEQRSISQHVLSEVIVKLNGHLEFLESAQWLVSLYVFLAVINQSGMLQRPEGK